MRELVLNLSVQETWIPILHLQPSNLTKYPIIGPKGGWNQISNENQFAFSTFNFKWAGISQCLGWEGFPSFKSSSFQNKSLRSVFKGSFKERSFKVFIEYSDIWKELQEKDCTSRNLWKGTLKSSRMLLIGQAQK